MSVRGLANSSTKQYCITYHAKVQGREYVRSVTIRERFPPTDWRSFTAARDDFQRFARNQGSILFVNVTNVTFGACGGSSGGGGCTAPQSPVITATADEDSIFVDWAAVSGATSYIVKRSTTQGGPYVEIGPNTVPTEYDDTAVVAGTTYYYVVSAVNSCGTSGNSNEASSQVLETSGWLMADQDTFSDLAGTVPSINGGAVQCWKDQSGEGVNVTYGGGGPAPTLVTNALNSLPIVRWNGSSDSLVYLSGTLAHPFTLIMVLKFTSLGLAAPFMNRFMHGDSGTKIGVAGTTKDVGLFSSFLNSGITVNAGVVADGVFAILTFVVNGASSYIRVNGVQVASGTATAGNWANIILGEVSTGVDVAELIRSQGGAPSPAYISAQESYLSSKWNLPI